jgi:hypothetical protein
VRGKRVRPDYRLITKDAADRADKAMNDAVDMPMEHQRFMWSRVYFAYKDGAFAALRGKFRRKT